MSRRPRVVEFVQVMADDAPVRLNHRYVPVDDYLEIVLRNAQAEASFRKIVFRFFAEGSAVARDGVFPTPQLCEVDTIVRPELLQPDVEFLRFRRATKEALIKSLQLLRAQWSNGALDVAVERMDENPEFLECRLDYACATSEHAGVEILYRWFADHIELVARVARPGAATAEHELAATRPGAPIPHLVNFFPVASVQILGRGVSVRGAGKRVLKEFPLP